MAQSKRFLKKICFVICLCWWGLLSSPIGLSSNRMLAGPSTTGTTVVTPVSHGQFIQELRSLRHLRAQSAAVSLLGRHLYNGPYYVAIHGGQKAYLFDRDHPAGFSTIFGPQGEEGIILGFGDSGGDSDFLKTIASHSENSLAFWVGESEPLAPIWRTGGARQKDTEKMFKIIQRALDEQWTYKQFLDAVEETVKTTIPLPSGITAQDRFKVRAIFADKDETLSEAGKPLTMQMAKMIGKFLSNGIRFVVVSSNELEELSVNLVSPVESALGEERAKVLSELTIFGFNTLRWLSYDTEEGEYRAGFREKGNLSKEELIMILKIYVYLFAEFLKDPQTAGVVMEQGDRKQLHDIAVQLAPEILSIDSFSEEPDPQKVVELFNGLLKQYREVLGNMFLKIWSDQNGTVAATMELKEAAQFLKGQFPQFVRREMEKILSDLAHPHPSHEPSFLTLELAI